MTNPIMNEFVIISNLRRKINISLIKNDNCKDKSDEKV